VSSVITGGEFIATYHYEASSEQEAKLFSASISAKSVSGSEVSTDIKDALNQFAKSERLEIKIIRKGPIEDIPALTPEAITKYAQEFPKKVSPVDGGHPYPVSFSVTPYSVFGIPPPDIEFSPSRLRDYSYGRELRHRHAVL
jgi:hypothetical protein